MATSVQELELFDSRKIPVTNTIATKDFVRLGNNGSLEAHPTVIHFGGYSLHKIHSQKLRVFNVSTSTQRVHIVPTTTPNFRVKWKKKGIIAPGMSEDITVEFEGNDWKYYYDCIRVHSDTENILVPMHAYPVMNDVIFPRHIDFGMCPLGVSSKRVVTVECKIPIQFEFELSVLKPHPDFIVGPLRGVVPANGTSAITITYTPGMQETSFMDIQINISQFNFEPFTCHIVGSARAGLLRAAEVRRVESELSDQGFIVVQDTRPPSKTQEGPAQASPKNRRVTNFSSPKSVDSGFVPPSNSLDLETTTSEALSSKRSGLRVSISEESSPSRELLVDTPPSGRLHRRSSSRFSCMSNSSPSISTGAPGGVARNPMEAQRRLSLRRLVALGSTFPSPTEEEGEVDDEEEDEEHVELEAFHDGMEWDFGGEGRRHNKRRSVVDDEVLNLEFHDRYGLQRTVSQSVAIVELENTNLEIAKGRGTGSGAHVDAGTVVANRRNKEAVEASTAAASKGKGRGKIDAEGKGSGDSGERELVARKRGRNGKGGRKRWSGEASRSGRSGENVDLESSTVEDEREDCDGGDIGGLREDEAAIVEGLRIPAKLEGVHSLNFVLTQTPGKLKPKDLKAAVIAQKAERSRQQLQQKQLREAQKGECGGVGDAEEAGEVGGDIAISAVPRLTAASMIASEAAEAEAASVTRQLKEMVFMQDVAAVDRAERRREFTSRVDVVGEDPLTELDLAKVRAFREAMEQAEMRQRRQNSRNVTTRNETEHRSISAVPTVKRCNVTVTRAFTFAHAVPKFDIYVNDLWGKRKRSVLRFVDAVCRVILRRRVKQRLEAVHKRLGNASTKQQVRALVEADQRSAALAGNDGDKDKGDGAWTGNNAQQHHVSRGGRQNKLRMDQGGGNSDGDEDEEGWGGEGSFDRLLGVDHHSHREPGGGAGGPSCPPNSYSSLSSPMPRHTNPHLLMHMHFHLYREQLSTVSYPLYEDREGSGIREAVAEEDVPVLFQDLTHTKLRRTKESQRMGYSHAYSAPIAVHVPLGAAQEAARESSVAAALPHPSSTRSSISSSSSSSSSSSTPPPPPQLSHQSQQQQQQLEQLQHEQLSKAPKGQKQQQNKEHQGQAEKLGQWWRVGAQAETLVRPAVVGGGEVLGRPLLETAFSDLDLEQRGLGGILPGGRVVVGGASGEKGTCVATASTAGTGTGTGAGSGVETQTTGWKVGDGAGDSGSTAACQQDQHGRQRIAMGGQLVATGIQQQLGVVQAHEHEYCAGHWHWHGRRYGHGFVEEEGGSRGAVKRLLREGGVLSPLETLMTPSERARIFLCSNETVAGGGGETALDHRLRPRHLTRDNILSLAEAQAVTPGTACLPAVRTRSGGSGGTSASLALLNLTSYDIPRTQARQSLIGFPREAWLVPRLPKFMSGSEAMEYPSESESEGEGEEKEDMNRTEDDGEEGVEHTSSVGDGGDVEAVKDKFRGPTLERARGLFIKLAAKVAAAEAAAEGDEKDGGHKGSKVGGGAVGKNNGFSGPPGGGAGGNSRGVGAKKRGVTLVKSGVPEGGGGGGGGPVAGGVPARAWTTGGRELRVMVEAYKDLRKDEEVRLPQRLVKVSSLMSRVQHTFDVATPARAYQPAAPWAAFFLNHYPAYVSPLDKQ